MFRAQGLQAALGFSTRLGSQPEKKTNKRMEGFHVDDSANCSVGVIAGSFAGLALQPIMGLLPKRGARVGGRGVARTASGRAAVKERKTSCYLVICRMVGPPGPAILRSCRGPTSARTSFRKTRLAKIPFRVVQQVWHSITGAS
jgi:hypothetical protein